MRRRTFCKSAGLALLAGSTFSYIPTFANQKQSLRLGGPVHTKYTSPEEWVNAIKNLGYRAAYCPVQIGANETDIQAYKRAAKDADIIIAEVGAWSNPISPDATTAKEAMKKCIQSLHLADQIGANCCVNIAGSRHVENWSGPHKENFSDETFEMIVTSVRQIIDEVKPQHTFYTLEAMPWIFPETADSYLKLIKAIDRKAFAVHLDPVNMVTSPAIFYKNGDLIKDCFKKLGPHIKSCHAKDLILKKGTFMPQFEEVQPGLGDMDYHVFLSELRKFPELPIMMEHLETEQEYKAAAKFIWEKNESIRS